MKELPINNVVPANDNVSGTSTETNAVENERSNHTHDDLAYNFIHSDEDMNNAIENEKNFKIIITKPVEKRFMVDHLKKLHSH